MSDVTLIELINRRLGNVPELLEVEIDRTDLEAYIRDAVADMRGSGVPASLLPSDPDTNNYNDEAATCIFCYVAAYFGTDRGLTNRYLTLYRNKVFRLALDEEA